MRKDSDSDKQVGDKPAKGGARGLFSAFSTQHGKRGDGSDDVIDQETPEANTQPNYVAGSVSSSDGSDNNELVAQGNSVDVNSTNNNVSNTPGIDSADGKADSIKEERIADASDKPLQKISNPNPVNLKRTNMPEKADMEKMLDPIIYYYKTYELLKLKNSTTFNVGMLAKDEDDDDDVVSKHLISFPDMKYFRLGTLHTNYLPGATLDELLSVLNINPAAMKRVSTVFDIINTKPHTLGTMAIALRDTFGNDLKAFMTTLENLKNETYQYADSAKDTMTNINQTVSNIRGFGYGTNDLAILRSNYLKAFFDLEESTRVVKTDYEINTSYIISLNAFIEHHILKFKEDILQQVNPIKYDVQVNAGASLAERAAEADSEIELSARLYLVENICKKFEAVKPILEANVKKDTYIGPLSLNHGSIAIISMKYPFKEFKEHKK